MPLGKFRPATQNANRHTQRGLKALRDSIQAVGYTEPMVAAADGELLSGSARLETVADVFGVQVEPLVIHSDGTRPVIHVRDDVPNAHTKIAQRIALAANQVAALDLNWDVGVLVGFDADVIEGLWAPEELSTLGQQWADEHAPELADAGPEEDKAAELQAEYATALGQVWELGAHRLIVGDCTDAAVVAKVMDGAQAALVVTDPPYGVKYADKNAFLNAAGKGNNIQTDIAGDHGTKAETQAMWKAAFQQMAAVMQPGAVIYCFMPQGGDQMMMMMMMMMQGADIEPRHELIWLKNNHVLGRVDYAYKHEPILYAWKAGGHHFYGDFQTSILEFPKPQKSDLYPTTKPVELIERLVSNSSLRGEIVLDSFLGSGTTLVACEKLGRKCRAAEIEPKYAAVAISRWEKLTGHKAVLAHG